MMLVDCFYLNNKRNKTKHKGEDISRLQFGYRRISYIVCMMEFRFDLCKTIGKNREII